MYIKYMKTYVYLYLEERGDDVAPAHELAVHVQLRDGRPVAKHTHTTIKTSTDQCRLDLKTRTKRLWLPSQSEGREKELSLPS